MQRNIRLYIVICMYVMPRTYAQFMLEACNGIAGACEKREKKKIVKASGQ